MRLTQLESLSPIVVVAEVVKCIVSGALSHHGYGIIDRIEIGPESLRTFAISPTNMLSEIETEWSPAALHVNWKMKFRNTERNIGRRSRMESRREILYPVKKQLSELACYVI
jgi:hypothetical protein